MTTTITNTILSIHAAELCVRLGWEEEERAEHQVVLLDVDLHFPAPPKACTTDQLEDSICYDTLLKEIRHHIRMKEFRLIEHLSHSIYQHIKTTLSLHPLGNKIKIMVRLTKHPLIRGLTEGVSFCYGDLML